MDGSYVENQKVKLQCFSLVSAFLGYYLLRLSKLTTIQKKFIENRYVSLASRHTFTHGLRTPGEEIAFTERSKIHSQSQIFRYGQSIFCLLHRSKFSDIFDLCLHWVSVVRGPDKIETFFSK